MRRALLVLASLPLIVFLASADAIQTQPPGRSSPAPAVSGSRAPKLVVLLVVDQMRADYVARFSKDWTGGLRRLLDEGAVFTQATYPHLATITCVSHASISTGSLPRTHGVPANDLWDRAAGRSANCVADPDTTLVSYGAPVKGTGTSTKLLLVPTLADELRAQLAIAPRIVTMSMKDYTATMLAGRRADSVAWANLAGRTLVTSSAFSPSPVPWVAAFLKANPIEADYGKSWSKALPDAAYLFPDEAEGELPVGRWSRTFPHALKGAGTAPDGSFYVEWESSPFSDRLLARLAQTAVDELKLGQGAGTDYLAISFSALDLVGHSYGPRSQEAQDLLAHLDRTLGSLLAHLDRKVGRANYSLALTGDHGVSPVPEQMASLGLNGGRILTPDLFGRIEKALEPFLGPGKKVARMAYSDLYFGAGVYDKMRANPEAMRAAVDAARSMPGVARVLTSDELTNMAASPADELTRAALASFYPGRSGDFIVIAQPYYQFASSASRTSGSTHGSPYWYDRHVPLFLLGKGVRKGTYNAPASPIDVAPTLAYLCGVTLPAADGRVLAEAITDR